MVAVGTFAHKTAAAASLLKSLNHKQYTPNPRNRHMEKLHHHRHVPPHHGRGARMVGATLAVALLASALPASALLVVALPAVALLVVALPAVALLVVALLASAPGWYALMVYHL